MDLKELIKTAWRHYIKTKSHLPITYFGIEEGDNTPKNGVRGTYKVCFVDTDIEYSFQHVFPNSGNFALSKAEFYVVISNDILDPATAQMDLLAKIPSNISDEKRVILRIAWRIHTAYRNHILTAYKLIEKDPTKITWANAKKWHDAIR